MPFLSILACKIIYDSIWLSTSNHKNVMLLAMVKNREPEVKKWY